MTGLDVRQLKYEIVRPTLIALGLWSPAAENLLTGTALAESRAAYVRQVGGGPALGIWQMEPATHDDCWTNFLRFPAQSRLATKLQSMLASDLTRQQQLITNLRYACAMARIRFYRARDALPASTDAAGLSAYHKNHYNTAQGAADAAANVAFFAEAIAA
ncbi:hypothetical protein Gbth_091_010 [Gluconobacter thailandicus F149-1 = NBRC 100600]|uniref:Uncharacterized protein n=1 Tax=Gluconobacter thailandicus NBRC 3257 TaxID=1381097 RepID=A0ABQ0J074_GLUTH|nr:hypothetical protein [Gluconobacter thailandicus]KXV52971.1 hypothetical protein AD946_10690 [Gluconobacter thailandicus]GAC86661.1 hypothetical protein NBRC3255_0322 [Gluconobacter thailandicus NBRC 3255]GAD27847.1 hypothetical protein NBRC3257_2846 [Gluconobacter thailandicus NBRC 3257]GAN94793.1 hypothetical protein Gbth_091_010 [Gluconobacter thailandicus F149-1 = NBRC 100600]GBR59562.1 hypothetical protein AA100600_1379 [Gluconobacter thailandicus F149-1 = NBRC 100600]